MQGNKQHPGLSPRVVDYLYELIYQQDENSKITITCNMIELYKNSLIDLLVPKKIKQHRNYFARKLEIKEDYHGQIYIKNAKL